MSLPLSGRSYVITREFRKGEQLATKLSALGGETFCFPTIETRAISHNLEESEPYDWVLFTSANSVRYFLSQAENLGHLKSDSKTKIACVGPSTAATLGTYELKADLVAERHLAEGLLEALRAQLSEDLSGFRFLLPRAKVARDELPKGLREKGGKVDILPVYETVCPAPTEGLNSFLKSDTRVLFMSSSAVKNWVEMTKSLDQPCYSIGPLTTQTAVKLGLSCLGTAEPHNLEGLLEMLRRDDGAHSTPGL